MSKENRPLSAIRADIDAIDRQLVDLLCKRTSLTQEVGKVKGRDGKPYFSPEREREIFERLKQENPGPLQHRQLAAIFREIISAGRAAESPINCAFWGPLGTFSHMAALQAFGASTDLRPCDSISDVFAEVEKGQANYGVAPVENSIGGVVPETLDAFLQSTAKICAELYLAVRQHLVSTAPDLASIERVYAGPQPAQQCRKWLQTHLPKAEIVQVTPTVKSAERAMGDPKSAAIANSLGAESVGIPILVENIHDQASNRTRFLVLGFNEPARTGRDKTSLMIRLYNKPGELHKALGALDARGANLILIESRPIQRGNFEYVFFVDLSGHWQDESVRLALQDIRSHALQATVLGSYPLVDPES